MTSWFYQNVSKLLLLGILVLLSSFIYGQDPKPEYVKFLKGRTGISKARLYYQVYHHNPEPVYCYTKDIRGKNQCKMDFNDAEYGIIELRLIKITNIDDNNFKVIIKDVCINSNAHLQPMKNKNQEFYRFSKSQKIEDHKIFYKTKKNAEGVISLNFAVVDKLNNDLSSFACVDGTISIEYNISGIKKVDKELQKWNSINKESLAELCEFHHNNKNNRFAPEALTLIKEIDENLWGKYEVTKNKKACQEYIDAFKNCSGYPGNYISEADDCINAADDPPEELDDDDDDEIKPRRSPCKEINNKWKKFISIERSEQEILNFRDNNRKAKSCIDIDKVILEQFPNLEYSLIEEKNDEYKYKINNAFYSPRYKDISISDGLKIIQDRWEDEHILKGKSTKSGKFKILIRDELGRETVLAFGDIFEARMEDRDSVFDISIIGGKSPFKIELINVQNKKVEWTKEDLEEPFYSLKIKELALNNLNGQFMVKIWDSLDNQPVEIKNPINYKRETSRKPWILGIFGMLVFVGGILLFIYLKKGKERRQTIFDH